MSWKDSIISKDPEEDSLMEKTSFPDDIENQADRKKELKADIVDLVEDGKSKSEIFDEIDRSESDIFIAFQELKNEGVLKKK